MIKRYKKRIFSGPVCEQIVWSASARAASARPPRPRFKSEQERAEHRRLIARRHCAQLVNSSFTPKGWFITLTFDDDNEMEYFSDARRERDNFRRRLRYRCPEARFMIFMGRGKSTNRIHFHVIAEGVTEEDIAVCWKLGSVKRMSHLREHNRTKDGADVGRDLTSLASYCFDHWTAEQGGHYYSASRNLERPEEEEATECVREYSEAHPPLPPKGYRLVEASSTPYGYLYFRYVKIPPEPGGRRRKSREPYYKN